MPPKPTHERVIGPPSASPTQTEKTGCVINVLEILALAISPSEVIEYGTHLLIVIGLIANQINI
jgi:hypothetical protein